MFRRLLVLVAAIALVLGASRSARADTLKVGTLAPGDSPWGQVFKVWAKAVDEKSNHAIQLQWFWNGTQGDENQMVGKIRTGQLDGAAITAVGLGQIYKHVLVFQMPGIFSSWQKLDSARNALKPKLEPEFANAGFTVLGWGDVGAAKTMSNGFEVRRPADLSGKGTFYLAGDPIGPALYSLIPGCTPKQVTVPEILPDLTNGSINVVEAPPLAAEQLQWASRITHINTMTAGYGIGALVFSSSRVQGLPADAQQVLKETGEVAGHALTDRIRNLDAQAFARLKSSKTAYEPNDAEKAEWMKLFADARARLRGATFDPAIFDEVLRLAQ